MSNKLARAIRLAIRGQLQVETQPDYCLRVSRQIIEFANGWSGGEFYNRINIFGNMTDANKRQAPSVPWARSAEQSFINKGWTVPRSQARPGDLVFQRKPAGAGHIGILDEGDDGRLYVFENAQITRGIHVRGALNYCPIEKWGRIDTIGRMPDAWVYDSVTPQPAPVVKPAPPAVKVEDIPVLPPQSTQPPVKVAGGVLSRVVMKDDRGVFRDRTGTRYELRLPGGKTLIVNAEDPGTIWIDVR